MGFGDGSNKKVKKEVVAVDSSGSDGDDDKEQLNQDDHDFAEPESRAARPGGSPAEHLYST